MIEIVEKIEKDSEKLKKLVEIDEMEDLYKLFKENGYVRSFSCFQGEIMFLLEKTEAALKIEQLEDMDCDSISGGSYAKDKWTKLVSTSMASLMALSSPFCGTDVRAHLTNRDIGFSEIKNELAPYLPTAIMGLAAFLGISLCGAIIIYSYYRSEKKLAAELIEHRRRMNDVLDEIRDLCYDIDSCYDSYNEIFKSEPSVKRLLEECIACLYHFPKAFFVSNSPPIVSLKYVKESYKKEYTYDRERFQHCISRCKAVAKKYEKLGRSYELERSAKNDTGRANGVSVNVNVYTAQPSGAVTSDNSSKVANNKNTPCNKEECEDWVDLINKVVKLSEYIVKCEKSSPIRFKYVAPPPPPPKPQTLSPSAQSNGRNFSRY